MPAAMARLEGAYSVVAIADGRLLAFRDPPRLPAARPRPLGEDWVVASETCTFDLLGAELEREIAPELVMVNGAGLRSIQAVPAAGDGALCIFEYFYFSRPDSHLAGVEAHARVRMGERLAEESPVGRTSSSPSPTRAPPRPSASRERLASHSARA